MEQLTLDAAAHDAKDERGYLPGAPFPHGAFEQIGTYGRLWVGFNLGGEKAGCEAAHYSHHRGFPGIPPEDPHLLPTVGAHAGWHAGQRCFFADVYAETARLPYRSRHSRTQATHVWSATWAEAVGSLRALVLATERWMDEQVALDLADEVARRDNPCAGTGQECGRGMICAVCGCPDVAGPQIGVGRWAAIPHVAQGALMR